jgi:hypothetical protein
MLAIALIIFFYVVPVALALLSGIIVAKLGVRLGSILIAFALLWFGGSLFSIPRIVWWVGGAFYALLVKR